MTEEERERLGYTAVWPRRKAGWKLALFNAAGFAAWLIAFVTLIIAFKSTP